MLLDTQQRSCPWVSACCGPFTDGRLRFFPFPTPPHPYVYTYVVLYERRQFKNLTGKQLPVVHEYSYNRTFIRTFHIPCKRELRGLTCVTHVFYMFTQAIRSTYIPGTIRPFFLRLAGNFSFFCLRVWIHPQPSSRTFSFFLFVFDTINYT